MNARTLSIIGRAHSPDDVRRAMALVLDSAIPSVNMDIIVGLPGETAGDVARTLDEVSGMQPQNLTVHTLAIKRAAKWRQNLGLYTFPTDAEVVGMVEQSRQAAVALGMHPYYLYRQRFIAADLENVGYCTPGNESIYNIQMMEERQTVVGLGGGGVTKLVAPGSWELARHFNPKCPATYAQTLATLLADKVAQIRQWSAHQ
jgi:oxygen-independent coproporphyrinogen III oxidase